MNHLTHWIKTAVTGLSQATSRCPGLYQQTITTICASELAEPGYWPTELMSEEQHLVYSQQSADDFQSIDDGVWK